MTSETKPIEQSQEPNEMSSFGYRTAWLAGYRQAVKDMKEASKQILSNPTGQCHDSKAR